MVLRVPIVKELPVVALTDEGMVKRIRGVAYSMKVSPQVRPWRTACSAGVLAVQVQRWRTACAAACVLYCTACVLY